MAARRIAVAMSGGVDSSVAAHLLADRGENIFGIMLRLWSAGPEHENRCCTPRDVANARSIAARLDIPFYVLDVKEYFKSQVVKTFLDGYAQGITPNPCISCNRNVRWTWLRERALAMGATHLATGHYARVEATDDHFRLLRAKDHSKDQSYVLHVLKQEQLASAVFPIGEMMKTDVRSYAEQNGLPVASRADSQDLCFLGELDYRDFLKQQDISLLEPGPITTSNGTQIGTHRGLAAYTIGQRKGIGIAAEEPYYVLAKEISTNRLVVGHRHELGRTEFKVGRIHWISEHPPHGQADLLVQVRYKSKPVEAAFVQKGDNILHVQLSSPVVDVTPGQWAVFYEDELCLGGGMILP
jgi:tRNA-specific 2-thiouridylase